MNRIKEGVKVVTGFDIQWKTNDHDDDDSLMLMFSSGNQDDDSIPLLTRMNLFRDLLLLLSCQDNNKNIKITACKILSYLISESKNGLRILLTSTFDLDESSQKKTTLDQRFEAAAQMIVFLPSLHSCQEDYFRKLGSQVLALLTDRHHYDKSSQHTKSCINKISTSIVNCMLKKKRRLTIKYVVNPIMDSLTSSSSSSSVLSIQESLHVIYCFINCHFDAKIFVSVFPAIFHARVSLESSKYALKAKVTQTLKDILERVDHSIHVLDDALFGCHDDDYYFEVTQEGQGEELVIKKKITTDAQQQQSLKDLKSIDDCSVLAIDLALESFSEQQLLDFIIILLERLSFIRVLTARQSVILCSLISGLFTQKVQNEILPKYPGKLISFLKETLGRRHADDNHDDQDMRELKLDTTSISLQILKVILLDKKQQVLSRQEESALKECLPFLDKLSLEDKELVQELKEAIIQLDNSCRQGKKSTVTSSSSSSQESLYCLAMQDINDVLMPTRAHGLICLKNLILSRDAVVLKNKKHVLQVLEASLSDPESYIYLSCINTLAALALSSPEEVLPLLLKSFSNTNRTIQERLNVAEVVVRFFRSINQVTLSHSSLGRQVIDCLKGNLRDPEAVIRVSSLSSIGSLCAALKSDVTTILESIVFEIESLVDSDPSLDVKRAGLMAFHVMLTGLDMQTLLSCKEAVKRIHGISSRVYFSSSNDDVSRLHAQLTLESLDFIAKEHFLSLQENKNKKKSLEK